MANTSTDCGPWQGMPLHKLKEIVQNPAQTKQIRDRADRFLAATGRRPRMLLSDVGHDGRQRIIKLLATSFARLGFDIDICPKHQDPVDAARMAIENDVHLAGILGGNRDDRQVAKRLEKALATEGGAQIRIAVFYPPPPATQNAKLQTGRTDIIIIDETMGAALLRMIDRLEFKI